MKNFGKIALITLCVPLLLTGCKKVPTLQDGKQVVVELDGKQFSVEELYASMREQYGTTALITMIDKYITEKELTDEMKKQAKEDAQTLYEQYKAMYGTNWSYFLSQNGLKNDTELLEILETSEQQNAVLKNYVKSTITDEEVQKYYDEKINGEMSVRHILIKPETKDDMTDDEKKKAKEEALNKAKELVDQLKSSSKLEEDFTELAKKESADTGTASAGGLLENITGDSGLDESFYEGALKLETGKITTDPIESQFGYHIIYKVSQKEKPALDTIKDSVIDKVVDQEMSADKATYIYWAALREKYNMNIHDDVIKDNYDLTMKEMNKES